VRTPAIVVTRDRVTYTKRCVNAFLEAGCDVHIVDHGSSWPEMVEWLDGVNLPVHHLPNGLPRKLWDWSGLRDIACSGRYIVTDPDVVPEASCPRDWVRYLHSVLDQNPGWLKVGLGLRIDDLPDYYSNADEVYAWERQYWDNPMSKDLFMSPVDTTLALYRSLDECDQFRLAPALRTRRPYLARHLTWYEDDMNPTPEIAYYRKHLTPGISHWADPKGYVKGVDASMIEVMPALRPASGASAPDSA
jgi:hypothetical protein